MSWQDLLLWGGGLALGTALCLMWANELRLGYRRRRFGTRTGPVDRAAQPIGYWFHFGYVSVATVLSFALALYCLLRLVGLVG